MKNLFTKSLLCCIVLLFSALISAGQKTDADEMTTQQWFRQHVPDPKAYVNDFERIFTTEELTQLNDLIDSIKRKTTIEIAVLTLDSSMVYLKNFDSCVHYVANKWGVGMKGVDNGITIGISKSLRRIRIVFGQGIKMSDERIKEIIDSVFTTQYKKGLFYTGTLSGIRVMISEM